MMLSERVVRGLGLLVEFEILFVLLDDIFVGLLEVFGQDNVAIFAHRLHASLKTRRRMSVVDGQRVDVPLDRSSWCQHLRCDRDVRRNLRDRLHRSDSFYWSPWRRPNASGDDQVLEILFYDPNDPAGGERDRECRHDSWPWSPEHTHRSSIHKYHSSNQG